MHALILRAGWPACGLAAVTCAAMLVAAPRADILSNIDIAAPPSVVWSVLTDTDAYPAWNPMIAGLKGKLEKGAVIENIDGYGADRMVFWPTVLAANREHELRWRGRLWNVPGLFTAEHYFLLRAMSGGTQFTQGEHFTGLLLWLYDPQTLLPAFEAMNVALAARTAAGGKATQPSPQSPR